MLSAVIAVGPLVLGMNLDEIRAATPGVAWAEQLVSPHSGRVFGLQAPAALQVAGLPLDVVAQVHYYHQHLQFTGRFPAKDAASCEQAALAWLTAIEPQAGPFTSAEPRTTPGTPGNLQWHSSRGPNGIVLTPSMGAGTASRVSGELLPFGTGSRALVATFDDQFRTRPRKALFAGPPARFTLEAFRRLPAQNVEVLVEYHAAPLECALRVAMVRRTEPPPPTEFDTAKARVALAPSVAVRHWLLPDAVAAATAAVEVPLRCDIDRVLGAPTSCTRTTSDPLPPVFEVHAQRLAREVFYDMAGQDRDDPQPMTGLVQVRLDPADRRPMDFLAAPQTPLEQVVFTAQLNEEESVLPLVHQNWGSAEATDPPHGTVVEVTLTCQIQVDGSLLCGGGQWAQRPGDDAFRVQLERDAQRLAAFRFQVAAKLKDGSPSAGRVIPLMLRFRK